MCALCVISLYHICESVCAAALRVSYFTISITINREISLVRAKDVVNLSDSPYVCARSAAGQH